MSGYAEEARLEVISWRRRDFGFFEYSYTDEQIGKKLENELLDGEELLDAVHRFAQVATVTGSVQARVTLARFGGIRLDEATLFANAAGNKFEELAYTEIESEVLRRAREERKAGNYEAYVALSACVGFYPPETGDYVPVSESRTIVPGYDNIISAMWQALGNDDIVGASASALKAGLNPDMLVGDGK